MSLISIDNPKEESFHFRNGVVVRMDYGISSAKMMGCLKDICLPLTDVRSI